MLISLTEGGLYQMVGKHFWFHVFINQSMKYLFIWLCFEHNVLFNALKSSSAGSEISQSLYFVTVSLSKFHLALLRFWSPLPLSVREFIHDI